MTRTTPMAAAALIAAVLLAASTHVSAQGGTANKRTFLTFSGAVQVPGATLPAGTYVFRLANPNAQTIWQVLDSREHRVFSTFYDVPRPRRTTQDQNRAGGKPVVTMGETAQGIPPAIRVLYYPTDLYGSELIYPRAQAQLIANATRQPVLATDTDATHGGAANIFTVEPETTEAQNNSAETAAAAVEKPATPTVEQQASTAEQQAPQTVERQTPRSTARESRPAATSGAAPQRPVGTSGRNETAAPRPTGTAGRSELPGTASPLPVVGLIGLLALACGIGVRLARRAPTR